MAERRHLQTPPLTFSQRRDHVLTELIETLRGGYGFVIPKFMSLGMYSREKISRMELTTGNLKN